MNVSFVDHDHPESPTNKSIANWGDAEKVCDVVADLLHWNRYVSRPQPHSRANIRCRSSREGHWRHHAVHGADPVD